MDITHFVTWFIGQVVTMFSWFFSILANIKFCGTNLLDVIIAIIIFSALLPVILTLTRDLNVISDRSERLKEKKERAERRAKKSKK